MSRPLFWFSADGRRAINLATVCHTLRYSDGATTVWTVDCASPNASIDLNIEDGESLLVALKLYAAGTP